MTNAISTAWHSEGTSRDFYQDLHRAFDATLEQCQNRAALPKLVEALMSQVFDTFTRNVNLQSDEDGAELACHRGCASCCTLRVAATAPEVFVIARYLRRLVPDLLENGIDVVADIREVDQKTRSQTEAERVALRIFCPFVAPRGLCVIYGVRPLACRGHASLDVRACVEAALGRRTEVPFSPPHRMVRTLVQNAMQSSLRDGGFAWGTYDLNHALLIALDDPAAESAWLAGEDVLGPAALHEVPVQEMAEVFDALRPSA